jgi:hypothetical protein
MICLLLRVACRYLPPMKSSAVSCEVSREISVLLQIIWHLEEILPGVILMPVSNLSESGEAATSISCQNVTCQYWRCFAYDKYYQPLYTAAIPWNIDANTRQLEINTQANQRAGSSRWCQGRWPTSTKHQNPFHKTKLKASSNNDWHHDDESTRSSW